MKALCIIFKNMKLQVCDSGLLESLDNGNTINSKNSGFGKGGRFGLFVDLPHLCGGSIHNPGE